MGYLKNLIRLTVAVSGCCALAASCSKMDHTYKPIIKNGEIVYTGKADSVQVYSGNGRVALSWLLVSDPKISYCRVFWNSEKDSLNVPVTRSAGIDTIRVVITGLSEGTYTFNIYTGDQDGHRSVAAQISGKVYGDQYSSTLYDRIYDEARWTDGVTTILWEPAVGGLTGTELSYTDTLGETIKLYVPATSDTTMIGDLKEGTSIKYRTLFMPDSTAIDTFYTAGTEFEPVFESEMDKSLFSEYKLAGDAPSAYGWVMQRLWDNSIHEPQGFFCAATSFPFQYTFDLGQEVQLSRYKIWQRGVIESASYLYAGDNPSTWSIWGAVKPASDGSWEGWTKLMDCQSIKPSGSAQGTVTDEDKAYALQGEQFVFPDTIPMVRYIRVQVTATWNKGKPQSNTMELTFWKKDK